MQVLPRLQLSLHSALLVHFVAILHYQKLASKAVWRSCKRVLALLALLYRRVCSSIESLPALIVHLTASRDVVVLATKLVRDLSYRAFAVQALRSVHLLVSLPTLIATEE
jgi:hypothetical protein